MRPSTRGGRTPRTACSGRALRQPGRHLKARRRGGWICLLLGAAVWVALLESGVEPVIVGLAMGLLTYATRSDLKRATERFREFREQPTAELARSVGQGVRSALSPDQTHDRASRTWARRGARRRCAGLAAWLRVSRHQAAVLDTAGGVCHRTPDAWRQPESTVTILLVIRVVGSIPTAGHPSLRPLSAGRPRSHPARRAPSEFDHRLAIQLWAKTTM